MTRRILGVFAGYLVFAAGAAVIFPATGHDPKKWEGAGFAAIATLAGAVFAFGAGLIAVRLANWPRAATALATVIAAVAILSATAQPRAYSAWSQIAVVLFMVPAALLGGLLARRRA